MTAPLGAPGSAERRRAVRKYFRVTPDPADETWALRTIWAGMALLLGAAALLLVGLPPLALLAVGIGAVVTVRGFELRATYHRRYAAAEPKPADHDMDRTLDEDLAAAARRAMSRLEVTQDELELHSDDVDPWAQLGGRRRLADQGRGPLVVFGPAEGSQGRRGVDRVWRFTSYDIMVICPTGHHLAIYECVLDFASGRRRDEDTHEYHYPDVVAVSTRTRPREGISLHLQAGTDGDLSLRKTMTREFEIIVSSGDRSAILVGIRDDDRPDQQIVLQESGIDRVIAAVRRMLREKKGGVAPTL
ncbi:hypothetical protein [Pseudonocardia sp. MH-G8]|uniref:hypothetical protein n=1 Tax=Pseudonocardia sp. MH-G8 TaxID=1854588 RepID=UPI000BA0FE95|nr:hypothetical protein [Pseudonocardia sp. MH-G8]OZM78079.1 hypothetical protein CFP66_32490 [Pseudonocardia sp. MH-G8]